ncbi:MAG: T9SS type A sorting domain-containing protein, partial [Ignavibacteriae bacterium]|nr:T9SS type A sorting domain-containing protein [Ignavibacteriota bacterium]
MYVHAQLYTWSKKISVPGLGNPLAYNPLNENTIYGSGYSSSYGEVNVSYDGGETWQLLSVLTGGFHVKSIIVNPNDTLTILVGQEANPQDRVMKSINGGATWIETLTGDFSYFGVPLEFNPAHPDTVFTMMGNILYRSVDFGSTWEIVSNQAGFFNTWCDAALRPDSVNIMYVGDNTSGIWKTTNGGVTFRRVYRTTGEIPMIAIDQQNPAVAYATKFSGGGGFLKTTDFGETWTEIPGFTSIDCWGVTIAQHNPNFIVMGTYTAVSSTKGIYISTDGGSTWTRTTCGFASPYNYGLLAIDTSKVFALQDDGIYKFQTIHLDSLSRFSISGTLKDSVTQLPAQGDVMLSSSICDSVLTFSTQTDSLGRFSFDSLYSNISSIIAPYRLAIDPELPFAQLFISNIYRDTGTVTLSVNLHRADVLVVGEDSANFSSYYKTALDSLGLKSHIWNTVSKGPAPFQRSNEFTKNIVMYFSGTKRTSLSQAELQNLTECLNSGCKLFMTGQDILEKNDTSQLFAQYLGISFGGNTTIVYARGVNYDLFDGFSFFTVGGGAGNQTSRDLITINNVRPKATLGYGATVEGGTAAVRLDSAGMGGKVIFMGFGFEAINTAATRKSVMQRVIGYLDGSIVVGVDKDLFGNVPLEFHLEQNYPNPFNSTTRIQYVVARKQYITLKVYDLLGREIKTLVNESKEPGKYYHDFDAATLTSGIYFYRLTTAAFTETKKFLVIK